MTMLAGVTMNGCFQVALPVALLLLLVRPLGGLMAGVLEGRTGEAPLGLGRVLGWLERGILRAAGVRVDATGAAAEMGWRSYAAGILAFSAASFGAVYALQRAQHLLPLNPAGLGPVEPSSAFNTAVSFVTNTNWQGYAGETTMSTLTQMAGLTVQNFASAAAGIAVFAALARGLSRSGSGGGTVGNCWSDLTRATLYILLPLSFVLAVALAGQGVVQTFASPREVALTAPVAVEGGVAARQTIPLGPVASQVAIKQLGTNGGGYFNANSAHPFENPTPVTDLLEVVAILAIPAGLCWTYGRMVGDRRQGWAVLAAMLVIFVPLLAGAYAAEAAPNPRIDPAVVDAAPSPGQPGGSMEGKEARIGPAGSARWAVATTAASNGSVNAMHDSLTPLGGLVAVWLIQLGEVVFGGVGSGLYGMLMFVVVAVFVAGLMVGRTPEYLGKKIGPFEMKMAALAVLIPCALVLLGTAVAVARPEGVAGISNPGPHGFAQVLYAFSSASNNNGSAFAGLSANTPFYNTALGAAMWFGRFGVAVPVLAVAGSMAGKRAAPATAGTLPTHGPVFVLMLVSVVVIVGALTFVPALALGPIAEHLRMSR